MRFQCPFCQGIVQVTNSDMGADFQCGHCGEMVSVPTSRVATGAVIADFIILEELGRGGMGVVYLSHQITLDRSSALKILAGAYANNPEFVVDFIKEARAAAKLNHPHIVQAYAVGEDEGIFFFAMEHIDGETMKDYMKREGVVSIEFALEVTQQIAEALDYAWKEQRLVHRDIKPDNIMLTRKGRAKLADLGLARVAGDIDDADSDEVMGTPQYISPEHLTGAEMDVRSDIYSLGATLFHLITGRFAFEGNTATEIAMKHLQEPLQSPREVNPAVPESVCRIIFKMMAKNANERYQSAEDLVEDLRLARQGKGPSSATSSVKKATKGGKQFSLKKGGSKTGTFQAASSSGGKTLSSPKIKTLSSSTTGIGKSHLTSTGSDPKLDLVQIRLEKEKKAKKQLIVMSIIVVVTLLCGAAFMIWNSMKGDDSNKKKKSAKVGSSATGNMGVNNGNNTNKPPKVSAYIKAADDVLASIKGPQLKDEEKLSKLEQFFEKNTAPSTEEEKAKRTEMMALYVPLDEERIKEARKKARDAHLAKLKKAEDEEKSRIAEEEKRKLAEQRKQELEEQKKQIALELEMKNKERLAKYINEQNANIERYLYKSFNYSTKKDYKDARKILQPGINEISKINDDLYKEKAQEVTDWSKKMVKNIDIAEKTWKRVRNAGDKIRGISIQIKTSISTIQEISNGIIKYKTYDNKIRTIPLFQIKDKYLKKVFEKIQEVWPDEPNGAFHFLFANGNFDLAEEFLPKEWENEFETSSQKYLIKKLEEFQEMEDQGKNADQVEKQKLKKELFKAGRNSLKKAQKALLEQ